MIRLKIDKRRTNKYQTSQILYKTAVTQAIGTPAYPQAGESLKRRPSLISSVLVCQKELQTVEEIDAGDMEPPDERTRPKMHEGGGVIKTTTASTASGKLSSSKAGLY